MVDIPRIYKALIAGFQTSLVGIGVLHFHAGAGLALLLLGTFFVVVVLGGS